MATAPSDLDPPATPSARRMAAARGIVLATLKGTGPGGKITRQDVEDAGGGGEGEQAEATPSQSKSPDIPHDAPSRPAISATPLARRIAERKGIDLSALTGSGPNGRIVKADVEECDPPPATAPFSQKTVETSGGEARDTPHEIQPLSGVRKVVARRLTEAKQNIPHIYLTLDIRLDPLVKLRGELNASLAGQGIKLSVNDLLIKALALALQHVPSCNVSFRGSELVQYLRQDISVAVAAPSGLITPIVRDAANKGLSAIGAEMRMLAQKARDGKLQPREFQGGTASLSNLGMFGIKQFDAVINPPQAMILAVGTGEQRPYVIDGALGIATIMSATGSFDHRAIDGADGAQFMAAFRDLVESPLALLV